MPRPGDLQVLAAWAPELADTFVALSCDIALVLDGGGAIVKLAQHASRPIAPEQWLGHAWAETAALDSQGKAQEMLAEVAAEGVARRREINHPSGIGHTLVVAYSAVRLGESGGPTLLVGHDLRGDSALQQRFVAAQEALERSYWHAHGRLLRGDDEAPPPPRMTERERASLGLRTRGERPTRREADDAQLLLALDRLYDRLDQDALPGLLRDARRVAERHFLQQALSRAGGLEALARSLGMSPRALARRTGALVGQGSRRRRGGGSA
ncbi:MAG: hypothetical protein U1F56_15225 [Rubrivivax sp.]